MSRKTQFRPDVQILETRRYMAADLGLCEIAVTGNEHAEVAPSSASQQVQNVTVNDSSISGNTPAMEGGGLAEDALQKVQKVMPARMGRGIETTAINGGTDDYFTDLGRAKGDIAGVEQSNSFEEITHPSIDSIWVDLGYPVDAGNTANASGYVIADAVRIERLGA